jgi:hypothetical protein
VTPEFFDRDGDSGRDALLTALELTGDLESLQFRLRSRAWLGYPAERLRELQPRYRRAELALQLARVLTLPAGISARFGSDFDVEAAAGADAVWTEPVVGQALWLALAVDPVSARIEFKRRSDVVGAATAAAELAIGREFPGRFGRLSLAAEFGAAVDLPALGWPKIRVAARVGLGGIRLEVRASDLAGEAASIFAEVRIRL